MMGKNVAFGISMNHRMISCFCERKKAILKTNQVLHIGRADDAATSFLSHQVQVIVADSYVRSERE